MTEQLAGISVITLLMLGLSGASGKAETLTVAEQTALIDDVVIARLACQVQGDDHLYDLRRLQTPQNGTPYSLVVSPTQQIVFDFCQQMTAKDTFKDEDWCLSDPDTATFAYLKDSEAKECFPLTSNSLYPTHISIENTYNPKHLKLTY